jgi:hypothetical protein
MSQQGSDVFPEEIAISGLSAADSAAISLQDADDRLLTWIKSAWPMLAGDVKSEIARLTGSGVDAMTLTSAGESPTR